MLEIILILFGIFIYFIPTLIAIGKRNFVAILALNLLLGWSIIFWIVALVWSLTKDKENNITVINNTKGES